MCILDKLSPAFFWTYFVFFLHWFNPTLHNKFSLAAEIAEDSLFSDFLLVAATSFLSSIFFLFLITWGSLALVGSPPRNGVSIKILVVEQPKIY